MGDSNFKYRDPIGPQAPYHCLEFKVVISALYHWVSVLQVCQVLIATDNTTVVSYINKQGGTHSVSLLRLVVDLFMWLQAQNIVLSLFRPNQPIMPEWSLQVCRQ